MVEKCRIKSLQENLCIEQVILFELLYKYVVSLDIFYDWD